MDRRNPITKFEASRIAFLRSKATGIPTIIKEMRADRSPEVMSDSDDMRTYFIATFPIHPAFDGTENGTENDTESKAIIQRQYTILQPVKKNDRTSRFATVRTNKYGTEPAAGGNILKTKPSLT